MNSTRQKEGLEPNKNVSHYLLLNTLNSSAGFGGGMWPGARQGFRCTSLDLDFVTSKKVHGTDNDDDHAEKEQESYWAGNASKMMAEEVSSKAK